MLQRISDEGADGFYRGDVAEAIVNAVHNAGGVLTMEDLIAVQPIIREPLQSSYEGMDLLSMPPSSSGGVAIIEMLNIMDAYEVRHPDIRLEELGHNSPEYVHLMAEVMKHAFADRAEYLGDADFADVPVERLLSHEHADMLASRIDEDTHPLDFYGRFALPGEDHGTSHFSVIDAKETRWHARGRSIRFTAAMSSFHFGIVLNNEMDDFAARPAEPNAFRLVQSEANAIEPGKRPLSSMSPTIIVRDGKAVYVAGASGGPRTITATLQVLLNMTRFDMTVSQA